MGWFSVGEVLFGAVALYIVILLVGNYYYVPLWSPRVLKIIRRKKNPKAGNTLSVLTWNLGYGGLGEESEFVADGGDSLFPPSGKIVDKNIKGIRTLLKKYKKQGVDVFCLQEVSSGSFLNYWRDVLHHTRKTLSGMDNSFLLEVNIRFIIQTLKVLHGNAIFSRKHVSKMESKPLTKIAFRGWDILPMHYGLHIARLPLQGSGAYWVVINVHLAPYEANNREAQVESVLRYAQKEYEKGNHVIIAGDWNLLLSEAIAPTGPETEWTSSFPKQILPTGWQVAAGSNEPTVRLLNTHYAPGANYTAVVDGFVVSPNVQVNRVETDAKHRFRYSDHNPSLLHVSVCDA
jgi:endonuclease/exonuclease/phosphatase family metal-dependent hydrolase